MECKELEGPMYAILGPFLISYPLSKTAQGAVVQKGQRAEPNFGGIPNFGVFLWMLSGKKPKRPPNMGVSFLYAYPLLVVSEEKQRKPIILGVPLGERPVAFR